MKSEMHGQVAQPSQPQSPVRGVIFVAGVSAMSEKLRRSDIFYSAPTELLSLFLNESTEIPLLTELEGTELLLQSCVTQRNSPPTGVAQIFNLLYRGFVTRNAPQATMRLRKSCALPNAIRRYGRVQLCATTRSPERPL